MNRAVVVAVGDEVVGGHVVNSNAAHISRVLAELGFDLQAHYAVPDSAEALHPLLAQLVPNTELIVLTGGLGPTLDDKTRDILAQYFKSEIVERPEVVADLYQRFGGRAASAADQALQPKDAELLLNPVGTAPGLLFHTQSGLLAAMPGVPTEMRSMLKERLVPRIIDRFTELRKPTVKIVNVCLTRESDVDAELRKLVAADPNLTYGIYPSHGTVSVHLKQQPGSHNPGVVEEAAEKLSAFFGLRCFPGQGGDIAEAIHSYFIEKGLTLSLAESCTGGALAARLTARSGASNYFLGGIVSYADQVKQQVLGVNPETIAASGAVSEATVREMVQGALRITGSDYAVSVSGIAGPNGGSDEKPVGTVWFAIARRNGSIAVHHFQLPGSRETIIQRSTTLALGFLWMEVQK